MSFVRFLGLFCLCLGLASTEAWAAKPRPAKFNAKVIKAFERLGIRQKDVSMIALPLPPYVKKRPLRFEHRANQLINPASVIKLFTTGLAFDKLGSTHQFKTGFHAEAEPIDGVLNGPLYVKGGADPVFLTEDLWTALRHLRSLGIKTIDGPVVLDRSILNSQLLAAGFNKDFDSAPHRAYHAKPDGLLMNHGAMLLRLEVERERVRVEPDQAPVSWAFVSNIRPQRGRCRSWKNGLDVEFKKVDGDVVVTVSGRYPLRCGASKIPITVPHQDWLVASWFKEIWAQLGGELTGEVVQGVTPAETVALYTHFGPNVSAIARDMNKWSSNVIARHLELAAIGVDGDFNQDILSWLKKKKVDTRGWFFENGSGLARQSRVDVRGSARFLEYMATRADFPDFLASLPRAGADGTLRRRLRGIDHFGYLKTGSLSGVKAVAGYLRAKSGQWYATAIFVESRKAYNAWGPMERALKYVYDNY